MRIAITVNGKSTEADESNVVADLLPRFGITVDGEGVAVAINGNVVRKHEWTSRRLRGGDLVEIIRAVQGG